MNNTEAFEAWYQNEYVQFGRANFHLNRYGEYVDDDIEASWCAWQAAIASQQGHIPDVGKMVQSQAQQEPIRPWICPNFMLPPRSEEVLVYPMPNNVAHTAFHDGECWRVTEYENNYGYSLVALPDGFIKGWMPIPPAPEGDKP